MGDKVAADPNAHIDALLEAAEKAGIGQVDVHQLINERKRKRAHAAAKTAQPDLGIRGEQYDSLLSKLKDAWDAPLSETDRDSSPGAMEFLLLTVQDTIEAEDAEDLIFAMMRVSRKALSWTPHLWRPQDMPNAENVNAK